MDDLYSIAQELGADDVQKRLKNAEALLQRSGTHVGIVGPVNCGKTTLLNGILQQQVCEPSLLPSQSLPLRVAFDRMADDERFECVHVFSREWGGTDAVMYEFSAERLLKEAHWVDELDVVFYLSPLSHFMTAEDKKAIASLGGMPVHVIATQCDRVAAQDMESAKVYAKKACERMNLAAPIFAGPDSWDAVSEQMRIALPATADLLAHRKAHQDMIKEQCRCLLIEHTHRLIEEENSNLASLLEQQEIQQRNARLASVTAGRICQEMKLRCSTAGNEMTEKVRAIGRKIDAFAQQMAAQGRQCRFDQAFRQRLAGQAEALVNEQLRTLEAQMKESLLSITSDAAAQNVLSERDLQSLGRNVDFAHGANHAIRFQQGTGNELPYMIQSAASVGAVSAFTLLSRMPTPWTIGVISASAIAGGAAYVFRNAASQTEKHEAAIKNWAAACVKELQTVLIPDIQRTYRALSDAMHEPPVDRSALDRAPVQPQRVSQLQAIADRLKAQ
ncbi:MAG: GTPase domain-containing protein [Clostridia bacterium]|nr:GTPase domain-containing protein [Clostridia bacterium]